MGIGKKDYSIRMENPFVHEDWDKDPKSTVSFQPTIELVEQGALGTAASPASLIYALAQGKTVLVATENLTTEGPQMLRDLKGLTPDIQRQAAEHFKGRVIDPDKFQLEDFVWAMDLLDHTYEYSRFPAEDLEMWGRCSELVRDLRVERRMFRYLSFVGYAAGEDFPDVQIAIHPVHQVDDFSRELGPRFPGKNALIGGFTLYAAFELGRAWQGKEENLKSAVEYFIEREKQRGRLTLRKEQEFPGEYFAVGIPEGPDDRDRNLYVSWSNWNDCIASRKAKETLPDLYERRVPHQVAYLGKIVKGFLAEKDKREAEDYAQAMEDKAQAMELSQANEERVKERQGFVPKEFGHGWVGPQPPPKGLENPDFEKPEQNP